MTFPTETLVPVNGQVLNVKEWSTEGRLLVFLHHLTGTCAAWDRIAPEMATGFRVIAVDLRGHGLSSKPASGYSWTDDLAGDVTALVRSFTTDPAILVGHSLGAMVSVPAAVNLGMLISDIVLVDPPAFDHEKYLGFFGQVLDFIQLPFDQKVQQFVEGGMGLDRAAEEAKRKEQTAPGVLAEFVSGSASYDIDDWLPRIRCRAHLVYGNSDKGGVVDARDFERLKRLCHFNNVSHWCAVGHEVGAGDPERFVAELKAFLC